MRVVASTESAEDAGSRPAASNSPSAAESWLAQRLDRGRATVVRPLSLGRERPRGASVWIIECPYCGYEANSDAFAVSLGDEAFCPCCNNSFLVEFQALEEDDEVDDEY